jgi:hypothetical protein
VSAQPPPTPTGSRGPGLTVQVRFQLADESAARELAARLIDRAHELANRPECECDLDVDVQWVPASPEPIGGPPGERPGGQAGGQMGASNSAAGRDL